jgi:hypothetical protein
MGVQTPQDGGDFLYEYEVDGEIVFAALGSDAGIEPSYRQAAVTALVAEILDSASADD